MIVQENQKWNFAYVMPDPPGSPICIVMPLALQMGWAESPSYFCVAMETGQDIIQGLMTDQVELPVHQIEKYVVPEHPAKRSHCHYPVHRILVYVLDNYIAAAVENAN